jgi:hypothetical protein
MHFSRCVGWQIYYPLKYVEPRRKVSFATLWAETEIKSVILFKYIRIINNVIKFRYLPFW